MSIQSENIEEIICTNCGRPNLPEAVKCWYCQVELNSGDQPAEQQGKDTLEPEAQAQQTQLAPDEDKNIPEWLQRIREQEQKERASQAAQDQWQQQLLFNGSSSPAAASPAQPEEQHKENRRSTEPPAPKEEPAKQPPLESAKPQQEPKPAIIMEADDEIPTEDTSEDLPDGFVKFDSNNN